jgi:hypothetical protein
MTNNLLGNGNNTQSFCNTIGSFFCLLIFFNEYPDLEIRQKYNMMKSNRIKFSFEIFFYSDCHRDKSQLVSPL